MEAPAGDPLVQNLADGREGAIADAYDRFGPALFRVAVTLLGARDRAEDAVQEVFLGLIRARAGVAGVEDLRAYLFTALYRVAAKLRARSARERAVPPEDLNAVAGPDAGRPDLARSVRLERALQALPAEQRAVVALKIDGGLTFAEAAVCLGVSPNTAASRYRYALEKLRAALGEAGHDP